MGYSIEVRQFEPQPAAAIRVTTTPSELGEVFGELMPDVHGWVTKNGHAPAGPPFGLYHSFGEKVDLEVGVPLRSPISAGDGRIRPSELPGGRVATTTHVGHYDKLAEVHEAVAHWCEANGHKPSGLCWESYVNDPAILPPEQWQTEVCWLLD